MKLLQSEFNFGYQIQSVELSQIKVNETQSVSWAIFPRQYLDEKLKTNINNIENALEKVLSLRGVEFNYIEHGGKSIGFIAQEVERIFPDLVFGTDPKSIGYQNFVAILVEAIKELNQKVDRLTNNQL